MVTFLLDVNAMFAALNGAHRAYHPVTRWLKTVGSYASCGLTQIGTFRLLVTPAPMNGVPLRPAIAHRSINAFTSARCHQFIACPAISDAIVGRTLGHKAAVDDYLVQIAAGAECRLATLDRALATRWPERAYLIN